MTAIGWKGAFALGAALAVAGPAAAQSDSTVRLGGSDKPDAGVGGATMTLGGTGTVADAAAADDTELTRHGGFGGYGGYRGGYGGYRGGYGGYRGGYGGYYGGYRGYYGGYGGYGGYRGFGYGGYGYGGFGYGGYGYGYRPSFGVSFYSGGYGGGYGSYYGGYGGGYYGGGGYCGISGTAADAAAPAVPLGSATAGVLVIRMPRDDAPTVRIVPAPTAPATDDLPVVLKGGTRAEVKTTAYSYKAYGEK